MNSIAEAQRQLLYELLSGVSGLVLALFMWGHVILVGSILTGTRGFDWLATMLEEYFIAQPTVVLIFVIFLVHAAFAARKIPVKLSERKKMLQLGRDLRQSTSISPVVSGEGIALPAHVDSLLWIWQVRTGLVILVLGSAHLVLLGIDVLTSTFGVQRGIEAATSMARVSGGLWLPYAILLLCVEFHASVGLYRLAIKWGAGRFLSRQVLHVLERVVFWIVLGLGFLTLLVLAGAMSPPLEFLLPELSS